MCTCVYLNIKFIDVKRVFQGNRAKTIGLRCCSEGAVAVHRCCWEPGGNRRRTRGRVLTDGTGFLGQADHLSRAKNWRRNETRATLIDISWLLMVKCGRETRRKRGEKGDVEAMAKYIS